MITINVTTSKDRFYLQALTVISAIPPYNKLTFKQIEMLAVILKQRDVIFEEMKELTDALKYDVLFNRVTKRKMLKALGVTDSTYRNNLHILNVTGFINNKRLNLPYLGNEFRYKDDFCFIFKDSNNAS